MNRQSTHTSLAALLVMVTCSAFALGQSSTAAMDKSVDDLLGDHVKFQQLMTTLQQDVAAHDASGVAILIHYPIGVTIQGKKILLKIPQDFIQNYDSIITPKIAEVIRNQRYEDLLVNYRGAMFGRGELWIAAICRDKSCKQSDLKIDTIQSTDNLNKK